jgi:hypothetical protein
MAALYALLIASHPRRVLAAYILAGFAFSAAVGVAIVAVFDGAELDYGNTATDHAIDLVAGAAALGFAAGVASGRAQLPSRESKGESAMLVRLRRPSVATAALAGVATHLPGLFYLIALNQIIADGDALGKQIVLVLVFNAIWFGAAVAAVVYFLIRPGAARRAMLRVSEWTRVHARGTTIAVFGVVGAYFAVKGAVGLAG